MKKNVIWAFAIALAGCGNSTDDKNNTVKNNADTMQIVSDTVLTKTENAVDLDSSDRSFLVDAALGGMVEVESSSKILTTTQDKNIKGYAEMMVADHGEANKKLASLARDKGYLLPKVIPMSKLEDINKMTTLKEEGKNDYYLKLMINEHKKAIDIFSLAKRSKDQQIRDFAAVVLPTLEHHYRQVSQIDSIFKQPKANQGDDPLRISDRKKQ